MRGAAFGSKKCCQNRDSRPFMSRVNFGALVRLAAQRVRSRSDATNTLFTLSTLSPPAMDGDPRNEGTRVYVGNLAWRTSWQDLKDRFGSEEAGVVFADVMRGEDGRSRGWGIVEFETPEAAERAIHRLDGTELDGRPITVREDRPERFTGGYGGDGGPGRGGGGGGGGGNYEPRDFQRGPGQGPAGCKVVVHGLPFRYSWRELKDLFNDNVGSAAHAEVVMDREGRSRGWGVVRFQSPQAAQRAIELMDGKDLEGRQLGVHLDRFGDRHN